jgi:hypothetical protein
MMEDWLERFAAALGVEPITPKEMGTLLKLSREVAHGVERKFAPLSTYLAGLHVGRRSAAGEDPDEALRRAVREALQLIPGQPA